MKTDTSASRLFNQFKKEIDNQAIHGFVANGATILTTNQELARDLLESAKVFAYENGCSIPIDLSKIGIDFNNVNLTQYARNVILIKSEELYSGRDYFDNINKCFNPTHKYFTAVIINNKEGADLLINSTTDTLILRHIQENNIDVSERDEYVPYLTMVLSREDDPGIRLHFSQSHQFADAPDRIKWLIRQANKTLDSGSENLSMDSEGDTLIK